MPPATSKPCPVCGNPAAARYAPFCGDRCRLLDLGRWLDESYALPGETAAPYDHDPDDDA